MNIRFCTYLLVSVLSFMGKAYSQCTVISGNINTNTYVCGLYGDNNGNSNWNWELADKTDPTYCSMWYAVTDNSGNETPMGSPFVDASTPKLYQISQSQDYTHAKGWELLTRNFGCSKVVGYPYFVLYNRYSGLMRIFVYQPVNQPQYSGITVQITPVQDPYPATTAMGDPIQAAPDQFQNTGSTSTIGARVIAVSEPSGSGGWSVAEFDPAFDPNINNSIYSGAALQFAVYGVVTYGLQAKIGGTTISGSQSNLNYSPKTAPSSNSSGLTTFTADGEQFATFGKDISDLMTSVNKTASGVVASPKVQPPVTDTLSAVYQLLKQMQKTQAATSSVSSFSSYVSSLSTFLNDAGGVFKVAGAIIGLFTSGKNTPAAAPVYTTYNLTLTGTLTAQYMSEAFIVRVPGTVQTNNNNGTYYQCPLGIVNINVTPTADTVQYNRKKQWYDYGQYFTEYEIPYTSYKITNDLPVTFYDGAGLKLVSVQAALMAKMLPGSDGKQTFNPLAPEMVVGTSPVNNYTPNWMAPDFSAGRLQFDFFDTSSAGLHIFQTPFVNLQCVNGLSITVPSATNVYLRIKAVLQNKNDPDNTPILYQQDFKIACNKGSLDAITRTNLDDFEFQIPPYANYTVSPTGTADRLLSNTTISSATAYEGDNSLTASNVTISGAGQVVFQAGYVIYLKTGFTAGPGTNFQAVLDRYGYTTACGTLQETAFESPYDCYNASITALAKKPGGDSTSGSAFQNSIDSAVNVYPIPTATQLTITGLAALGQATLTVLDQTGKSLFVVEKSDESPNAVLNVGNLPGGVYYVEIRGAAAVVTRKFIVTK